MAKKRRRRGVSLCAGIGLLAGMAALFGAPGWLAMVAAAPALVALYLVGDGQFAGLVERCQVLKQISSECLHLCNETRHLWSDVERGESSDQSVVMRLRELERTGEQMQVLVAQYGLGGDAKLNVQAEKTATEILQGMYA